MDIAETNSFTLRFDFTAMASPCCVQIDGVDERAMRRAADEAIQEVRRIEAKYSRYQSASVLSAVNRSAGAGPVTVDAETASLLAYADQLWRLSDGLFDVTSGVLARAWDFKAAKLPDPAVLQGLLDWVGWQHVVCEGLQVQLTRPGMALDFGGFGKEYATDRAAAVLQQHGMQHALVNLGGDLHALGARGLSGHAGEPWHIAIEHPRPANAANAANAANEVNEANPAQTQPLATLALTRGGLATSGDYERFFIHQGQRYCHVLNPKTGWPVQAVQSVSVLAANTSSAGAMATIAMLKGEGAQAWLDGQSVAYLLRDAAGLLHRNAQAPEDP
jgi:FAD:protein FMN transferase